MNLTRRNFIKTGSVMAAGITAASHVLASQSGLHRQKPISIFSKCLQFLDYDSMAEVVAELGFDGVDLIVRDGGHVNPENVERDLPLVVKALQKVDKNVLMMATNIVDADDKLSERILGTASELGIKYYRMGYFWYDPQKSIIQNLDDCRRNMEKLEALNRKYQINGGYQNHSGPDNRVGGPVWDLYYLLNTLDPEYIGVQYDIMHAIIEGDHVWQLGFELLKPWIKTIDFKDFVWNREESGWGDTCRVHLGQGAIDYERFIGEMMSVDDGIPVSIHYEYDLGGAEEGISHPSMNSEEIYKKLRKDLLYLRNQFKKTNK